MRRGLTMFFLGILRMFIEAWIVMLIWNNVVVGNIDVGDFGYWDTFFIMLMFRILMGQIKIGTFTFERKKSKSEEKRNQS